MILGNNGFIRRRLPAAASWWLSGGISSANAIGVYQPIGAADLAASYINLANPGTYDAAPGVAPTWASGTGWTFTAASSQYLTTGVVPASGWSMIAKFSNATLGVNRLSSTQGNNNSRFGLAPSYQSGGDRALYLSGGFVSAATNYTSGVSAVAGQQGYKDGATDGGTISDWSANIPPALVIGALNNITSGILQFFNGNIQAVAIYDTTLTADQVASVTAAMNLL